MFAAVFELGAVDIAERESAGRAALAGRRSEEYLAASIGEPATTAVVAGGKVYAGRASLQCSNMKPGKIDRQSSAERSGGKEVPLAIRSAAQRPLHASTENDFVRPALLKQPEILFALANCAPSRSAVDRFQAIVCPRAATRDLACGYTIAGCKQQ
jgi:hypothetical protein